MNSIKRLATPLLAGALAVGALACGSSDGPTGDERATGDVTVTDAWVREPADGQTLAAGYGTITNGSDETVTLVGAAAPLAATIELHETSMSDDGTMSMSEKEGGFDIAPGESIDLEPGGAHIMMFDVDRDQFAEPIELTFLFDSVEVTVAAEVRRIGDQMDDAGMDDAGMDDGSMGEMEDE